MKNACHLTVDGVRRPKLEQALLGVSVSNTVEHIPHAHLEFRDGSPALQDFELSNLPWLKPGAKLTIGLGPEEAAVNTVFAGLITHLRINAQNSGYFALEVECRHPAYRMTLNRNMRFFHNSATSKTETVATISDAEALDQLGKVYGLTITTAQHSQSGFQDINHENLPQYGSTDWDFLMVRADATGRLTRCVYNGVELTLPIPPEAGTKGLTRFVFGGANPNILEFKAEMDGSLHTQTSVTTSWDTFSQQQQSESNTDTPWDLQGNLKAQELAQLAGSLQQEVFHGGDLLKQEARAISYATMQRNTLAKIRATLKVVGDASLLPGDWVTLEGLGAKWNGTLFVGGVQHDYTDGLWDTTVQIGISPEKHAERYAVHYAPSVNLMPGVQGLLYGKVLQYDKSAEGHELVKVAVFSPEDSDQNQPQRSLYARISNWKAGNLGSATFRPGVNDEVLIGFINADPRFPVVLGALTNKEAQPTWPLVNEDGKLVQKKQGLEIKKKKGAWQLLFDEENDTLEINSAGFHISLNDESNELTLRDKSKANQIILNDKSVIVTAKDSITLGTDQGAKLILDKNVSLLNKKGSIVLDSKEIKQKATTGMETKANTIKFN